MANSPVVIVIGAGAAGLAAARRLRNRGMPAIVLEARGRAGGRAWTVRPQPGLPLDLGCGWLHSADRNPWTRLARRMGFTVDETEPPWSRDEGIAAASDQAEWRAANAAFERRLEEVAASGRDMPIAALLDPGGRWNAVFNAISTFVNGVELDRVSLQDHVRYRDSGSNWRVEEGYGALIEAFSAPVPVELDTRAMRVDNSGRRVRVETDRGPLEADAVIVTVPSSLIAAEQLRFVPALPDKVAAARGVPLGLDNKLFLEIAEGGGELPANHHLLGSTERAGAGAYMVRPHGRPVIECFFGGALARELEPLGDAGTAAFAVDELSAALGSAIRGRLKPVASSAWGADPFARGAYSYALPGHAGDRAVLAAPVDGRIFFAGEACSINDYSTAHGAYRTGIAAADHAWRANCDQGSASRRWR